MTKVLAVPNIPQNSYVGGTPLPTGCEVTSLAALMNYLGFENCGKNAHHYADYSETIINGEKMTEYGSCYIFPVNFEMRVDSVFLALINERREIQEQGG